MINLKKHLPQYYAKSSAMADILNPIEQEIAAEDEYISLVNNQMLISTATVMIDRYERELGIDVNTADSYEVRRNRILAKLRGLGTVTRDTIERIVRTYVDGIIEITEDYSNYTLSIKFITHKGQIANIDNIKKSISEVMPAHIKVDFIFTYRTWNDVASVIGTWNDVAQYTWDGLATTEVLTPLNIEDDKVYYRPKNDGNATIIYDENGKPFAHLII